MSIENLTPDEVKAYHQQGIDALSPDAVKRYALPDEAAPLAVQSGLMDSLKSFGSQSLRATGNILNAAESGAEHIPLLREAGIAGKYIAGQADKFADYLKKIGRAHV